MKKLHIINLEKIGGVERMFLQYINNIDHKNDTVICIGSKISKDISSNLKTKIIFSNRLFNNLPLRCPQFIRKFWLQWKISKVSSEIIIIWDLIVKLYYKPKYSKIIYYDHGSSWRFTFNKKTIKFFSILDGVISVSNASKRVMELRFQIPCKHLVVHNGIKNPININMKNKLSLFPLRLGTASRLVHLKGISVSLLTLYELISRGHDVTMEIIGKGPQKKQLEILTQKLNLSEHVIFSPFQNELSNFFTRIDIYMSTPITEAFGLSCLESLYHGVPVIFPLIDGQPEVISNHVCGVGITPSVSVKEHEFITGIRINYLNEVYNPLTDSLVKPKFLSHIDCANAVEMLMVDETYRQFSFNAQHYIREKFTFHIFEKKFQDALSFFFKQ
ncbi:glycosyltransferase [Candidatus Erwinia haradaeae]|uniref:Glycosyl transferase group 1 family protein n=1 Tax=Candidatus Erwinia haradaeae TaxID=1922217 RepID=A0A803GD95_9GAMM|nr:glycosyltransferase [Candidatus Erwinia haradaeae]VFP88693.1 Glycosyl transferase group 1 family protein [Candidatus Erwinia haradaeae]